MLIYICTCFVHLAILIFFTHVGSTTMATTEPMIMMARGRETGIQNRSNAAENRETLFECEECGIWFKDMTTFSNHACAATTGNTVTK